MSAPKTKQLWKSGSVRGYNGDGVSVTATHALAQGQKAPDTVDLRFFDNSVRPGGPVCRLRSFSLEEEDWVDIPLPDPEGKFGESINEGFTIVGQVRLEKTDAGHFVRVRFNWGDDQAHAEEGYIMRIGA